ncbi:hypothetical protein LR48_Vigan03g129500 [Vigna angularis]|uniref:Transposase (putative) gypsy type domain-containing protein n=1 Tax=Phaseolus angularis TaxID=3914 RepID=A0A0L9U510_PHAAN|nr:hypothetical protein LR48_Vigan03g129500 [Vigna angularis]
MAIVHVSSSLESAGREDRSSSLSFVSSSYLERSEWEGGSEPRSPVYSGERVINGMFVRVPFTTFQLAVLRELNVAPSQLHPNAWASTQAFVVDCSALGITPTILVFLHYFNIRPLAKRGWVSLTSVDGLASVQNHTSNTKW